MAFEKQGVNTLKHHLPSMVFIIFLRYDIAYSRCSIYNNSLKKKFKIIKKFLLWIDESDKISIMCDYFIVSTR